MNQRSPLLRPVSRRFERTIKVDRLLFHFPLVKAHAPAVFDVHSRNNQHGTTPKQNEKGRQIDNRSRYSKRTRSRRVSSWQPTIRFPGLQSRSEQSIRSRHPRFLRETACFFSSRFDSTPCEALSNHSRNESQRLCRKKYRALFAGRTPRFR